MSPPGPPTPPGRPAPSPSGLQAERTGLAWSRTSLGVAANALLLGAREIGHPSPTVGLLPAGLALVVAVATAVYGRARTRRLRSRPLPSPLAPRVAVPVLGGAVVVLGLLSGFAMVV